jgi:hypothetical protein
MRIGVCGDREPYSSGKTKKESSVSRRCDRSRKGALAKVKSDEMQRCGEMN